MSSRGTVEDSILCSTVLFAVFFIQVQMCHGSLCACTRGTLEHSRIKMCFEFWDVGGFIEFTGLTLQMNKNNVFSSDPRGGTATVPQIDFLDIFPEIVCTKAHLSWLYMKAVYKVICYVSMICKHLRTECQ